MSEIARFTHLNVASMFSPAWGLHSPESLCTAAKTMGMSRIALTDRNGVYAIPRFIQAARDAGIGAIVGAEAVTPTGRAVLLARNVDGYANLCRLLSDLHCHRGFDLTTALEKFRHGLVVISDTPHLLTTLRQTSGEALFVELSPGHTMHNALRLAQETGLPPVATTRALLLDSDDHHLHRVLRAIHLNTKLSRLKAEDTAPDCAFLHPPAKMADIFPHCPEALENAEKAANLCTNDWDFSETIFPSFRNLADNDAYGELERRARSGAVLRYGAIDAAIEERLQKELTIIRDKGFAHYFLVVEELAKQSERTCGRGSAAASLVAFCLDITDVDPIRHNLFFERFLNEGRTDPPDIDIDFPWDERDAILDFAFDRYGAQRAAMVSNQVGFKGKAAVREVAKVYGLPEGEIKSVTDRISGFWKADETAGAMSDHPLFRGEKLGRDWEEIIVTARRLRGHLRHLSLHCGGLVIVPDEIRRYVPVEMSRKGFPLIQWEKDQAEDAGLVKIDILGNRSLAVIRDALASFRKNTGTRVDDGSWDPLADAKTAALLRSGDTIGCFYLESPSIRLLLRRMWGPQPDAKALELDLFQGLVQSSSIIRPAANPLMREYVARVRGKTWHPPHPLLKGVLEETFGIAIYQEQITQIAMALADFSAYEGDQLRKIISKKHKAKKLADYRRQFFSGGIGKGVPEKVLDEVWDQIMSFAGYSFCKPHSASYSLVSARSAWLKAHAPAEFMAAVISNQGGYYSTFAYISECRRLGVTVLPPDINASSHHYTGYSTTVRVGLMQILGLTSDGVTKIMRARAGDHFRSFKDFLNRADVARSDAERLVKAGCFDALEGLERRPALLWELLHFHHREANRLPSLFDEPVAVPLPPAYDEATVLRQEIETLGFLVSRHPLTLHRDAWLRHRPVKGIDMIRHAGQHVTMVGWWITTKTTQDKHNRPMEFVSFEDTTAIYDTIFFADAYARFCRILSQNRPYLLKGIVEEEFGVPTLRVRWVGYL